MDREDRAMIKEAIKMVQAAYANYRNAVNNAKEVMEKFEEKQKKDDAWPKCGDLYFFIDAFGVVMHRIYEDETGERSMAEIGNIFRFEHEAEFELERRKVMAKIRKYAKGTFNDVDVCFLHYNTCTHSVVPMENYYESATYFGQPLFASTKDAETCIAAVGEDRLKKYFFGVQE